VAQSLCLKFDLIRLDWVYPNVPNAPVAQLKLKGEIGCIYNFAAPKGSARIQIPSSSAYLNALWTKSGIYAPIRRSGLHVVRVHIDTTEFKRLIAIVQKMAESTQNDCGDHKFYQLIEEFIVLMQYSKIISREPCVPSKYARSTRILA
jgi:hypothetical protein